MRATKAEGYSSKKIFRELRWEVAKIVFLVEALNAAILFFSLNIILTLFNMSFYPSAAVAVVFLVARARKGLQRQTLLDLEKGNPEVHEILRTAYEYRREESLMAQGLMYDLQRNLSTVSAGVLLDPRRIFGKIGMISALAFIPILIISFTPFLLQQNPFQDVSMEEFFDAARPESVRDYFETRLNRTEPTYGDAEVLDLGDEELGVRLRTGGGGVTFDEVYDPSDKGFRYNDFPPDIDPQQAEAARGNAYTQEELELIREYSCRTQGACPTQ